MIEETISLDGTTITLGLLKIEILLYNLKFYQSSKNLDICLKDEERSAMSAIRT